MFTYSNPTSCVATARRHAHRSKAMIRVAHALAVVALFAFSGRHSILAQSAAPADTTSFDRTKPPIPQPAKALTFPKARERTLRNGVRVVVLEDHSAPVLSVSAVVDVSSSLEPAGKTGINDFVRQMLGEGTTTRSADQLSDAFATLGNTVSPFGFYTITANLDRSLELMADQLLHPAFPEEAVSRLRSNKVADVRRAREDPNYLAGRVFATKLYGPDHPYARTPTESDLTSITRDDIIHQYSTYYRPPNVTFVVAGDITPERAVDKLNRAFGAWTPGTSGRVTIPVPRGVDSTVIYLYDRPGSSQSTFAVGTLGPRRDAPDYFAVQLMSTALGSAFTSRINLNLREQHHYAYGAFAVFSFRPVPEVSTFRASAAVETPKTDSALRELVKELRDIRGARPVSSEELTFARRSAIAGMPLQFETIAQRAGAVTRLVQLNLPLDSYKTIVQQFDAVTLDQARAAADRYIDPSKMVIVVVGDRKVIEPGLRAAQVAPIVIVDPEK